MSVGKAGERGDITEFEQIYEAYYPYVKKYVISLCFDDVLADDVAQETFLKAFQKIDSFKGDCKIETWLCRIAHNIFVSQKRRKQTENIDDYSEIASSFSVYGEAEDGITSKEILKILMTLESPYKDVFYMKAMGEMDYEVIAQVFGKTQSWARVTYFRARKMIAERLGVTNE